MTTITIRKTGTGKYQGFTCIGHAGYAAAGKDIVCASISVLAVNTVNSMEVLAAQQQQVVSNEKEGLIDCRFTENPNEKTILLMDSMVLGLQEIKKEYSKYIELKFEEV